MLKKFYCVMTIFTTFLVHAADSVKTGNTLGSYIQQGGWIMYVLLALSMVVGALVIYYLLTLREKVLGSYAFVQQLETATTGQKGRESLILICEQDASVLSEITRQLIQEQRKHPEATEEHLREVCQDAVSEVVVGIENRLDYLNDIAEIAPMFGLLGTVLGMMLAFGNTQANIDGLQIDSLATGVTQALVTTAAGLMVAVIAKILFSAFKARATGLFTDFGKRVTIILELVLSQNK